MLTVEVNTANMRYITPQHHIKSGNTEGMYERVFRRFNVKRIEMK